MFQPPGPTSPVDAMTYFFLGMRGAKEFYGRMLPLLKKTYGSARMSILRGNVVILWEAPLAKPYQTIVLGCLKP
jgi:hypothetical protein